MFRVIVDADTCEANAFCVDLAPDVFELGDDAPPVRVVAVTVDDARRAVVQDAVRSCPRQAISIEGIEADAGQP